MKTGRDASFMASRSRAHPRQLSDADAVFLSVESLKAPSHVAGLTILDPSSSSAFSFERYMEVLGERIDLVERFKWKLYEPALGLDRAYWIEDPDFDVARHVHRVRLRMPGDRAALAELAGCLHAEPLDRRRPLWECWWIDGLDDDRIAILLKIHHCLMDGQSGVGLSEILMDLTPEPDRRGRFQAAEREPPPRRPTIWEVGRRAVVNAAQRPKAVATHSRRALLEGVGRALGVPADGMPPRVPRVPFNGRLGPGRAFAFTSVPLGPLRDAKKHFNVTMNAVLLELVSSALRSGLMEEDALPALPIVGLCPVSLRRDGDERFGNRLASMSVPLATDQADARTRLARIHESAEAAKKRLESGSFETLSALGECLVPGALRWLTRVAHGFPSLLPLPGNLVISNVRGLPIPLYMAGARVEEIYPLSMLQVANGMNVTAVSHDDQVDFGFVVDSNLVRDPWLYANGIQAALRELEAIVAARSTIRASDPVSADSTPHPPPTIEEGGSSSADDTAVGMESIDGGDFETEPLSLHLIMAELAHLRAPSRRGIASVD
ncbi:MAG TPA: wax ester/triacylglycerol synthase family O-acyltransferase [Deltaproteobacteria bacterium]|nr:wax ester/triacylglycerol synthase family O-acyltransferase [Deltaproteobacteria bacterium]